MTLLTTEEYTALATSLDLATSAYIDGGYRPAFSGATFETVNPATGVKIADVAACNAEDVDFAVTKAREAFEDGRWSRLHPRAQECVDPLLQIDHPQPPRIGGDGKPGQRQNNIRLRNRGCA